MILEGIKNKCDKIARNKCLEGITVARGRSVASLCVELALCFSHNALFARFGGSNLDTAFDF